MANINVEINGVLVNFSEEDPNLEAKHPEIQEGRTYVPLRGVFEGLGFDVGWCPDERKVKSVRLKLRFVCRRERA